MEKNNTITIPINLISRFRVTRSRNENLIPGTFELWCLTQMLRRSAIKVSQGKRTIVKRWIMKRRDGIRDEKRIDGEESFV